MLKTKLAPRIISNTVNECFMPAMILLSASVCFWETWAEVYRQRNVEVS